MSEAASIDRAHARLGPSGWKRWSTCPGSVQAIDMLAEAGHPEDPPSEFAAEGTAMHWVREQALLSGNDVAHYIGQEVSSDGFTFKVEPVWVDWIQPGVDRLREASGKLYVERRVSLEAWAEGEFGTADATVVPDDDDGLIIIDDFKGGRGVIVDAERNGQLMQYALGAWENFIRHETKATRFLLRIDQPRVPGKGSEWECSLDDLLRFAEDEYVPAVQATRDPDAPLVPSLDACQFCPVAKAGVCGEHNRFVLSLIGASLETLTSGRRLDMPKLEAMTADQQASVVKHKSMISKWLGQVHGHCLSDALAGRDVPGFKAVATEGNREWRDPEEAEKFFEGRLPKKETHTMKLKSPAQMELVAGTRIWAKAQDTLIHRPPGPAALVPESDKRPALIPVLDMLDDLDDIEESPSDTIDDLI